MSGWVDEELQYLLWNIIPFYNLLIDSFICVIYFHNAHYVAAWVTLGFLFASNRVRILVFLLNDIFNYSVQRSFWSFLGYYLLPYCVMDRYYMTVAILGDFALLLVWPFYVFIFLFQLWSNFCVIRNGIQTQKNRTFHMQLEVFHTLPQSIISLVCYAYGFLDLTVFSLELFGVLLTFYRLVYHKQIRACCHRDVKIHVDIDTTVSKDVSKAYIPSVKTPDSANNRFMIRDLDVELTQIKLNGSDKVYVVTKSNKELLESSSEEESTDEDFMDLEHGAHAAHVHWDMRHNKNRSCDTLDVPTGHQGWSEYVTRRRAFTTDSSTVGMGASLDSKQEQLVLRETRDFSPDHQHYILNSKGSPNASTWKSNFDLLARQQRDSMLSLLPSLPNPAYLTNDPDHSPPTEKAAYLSTFPIPLERARGSTVEASFVSSMSRKFDPVQNSFTQYYANDLVDNITNDTENKAIVNFSVPGPRILSRQPSLDKKNKQEITWPRLPGFGDMEIDYDDDEDLYE